MNVLQRLVTTTVLTATTATVAIGSSVLPAQAAFLFGTDGISFEKDTLMEFNFISSNGGFQSSLGIFLVNGDVVDETSRFELFSETKQADLSFGEDDQWTGTCGNTFSAVLGPCTRSFTFRAGQVYTFGLTSLEPVQRSGDPGFNIDYVPTNLADNPGTVSNTSIVFSTSSLNGGTQRTVFGSSGASPDTTPFNATDFTSIDPFSGIFQISFEDGGVAGAGGGVDFNDFTISARVVPTPPLMGGLMLLGALIRRRQRKMMESQT